VTFTQKLQSEQQVVEKQKNEISQLQSKNNELLAGKNNL
jgi:hypothetical protein